MNKLASVHMLSLSQKLPPPSNDRRAREFHRPAIIDAIGDKDGLHSSTGGRKAPRTGQSAAARQFSGLHRQERAI
ncbi:hypothetical protein [Bradyrhizobium sp. RDT46]|uniref:hypothetical protein n=1 Tax=Bradyrhizobium sp. RDT46 TaxID=3341829 RepID=UPI0035C6D7AB